MINQATLAPHVRTTAAETLKTIKAYADTKKVIVTVENRDDPSGYVSSTVHDRGVAAALSEGSLSILGKTRSI